MTSNIPILGFSAYSGTGKTTLLCQIIPALKRRGLRVSVIKHAHHDFDLDFPGKDSYELRKSGADQTVICTMSRMATITGRMKGAPISAIRIRRPGKARRASARASGIAIAQLNPADSTA